MKVAITADLHLSSYRQGRFDPLTQVRLGLLELASQIKKYNVEAVIVAGDIFHDKTLVYRNALTVLYEFLDLTSGQQQVILLQGNHDIGRYGSLLDIITYEGVQLVTEPTVIDNILLVPWLKGNMLEIIYEQKRDYTNVLISHFGLNEAKLQSGISFIDPIKLKDLKMFDKVILGHYHLAQEIGNVIYCGNLAPLDWNDKNQKKRFLIMDTETLEIESIPITSVKYFYEFIDPDDEQVDKIKQLIDEGHIVRIISKEKIDISGASIVYNVEPSTRFSNMTNVYDISKKYIEDHPEKDELLAILDEIDQNVRTLNS